MTRNKKIFWKNPFYPRFWRVKQLCAHHSYICRHGLYVIYIVTQTPSFCRSRDLDKSNKFGQMQELTNDNYSEIKLCSIFRIEYKAISLCSVETFYVLTYPCPECGRVLQARSGLISHLRTHRVNQTWHHHHHHHRRSYGHHRKRWTNNITNDNSQEEYENKDRVVQKKQFNQ